jgi:hypothetical protein
LRPINLYNAVVERNVLMHSCFFSSKHHHAMDEYPAASSKQEILPHPASMRSSSHQ